MFEQIFRYQFEQKKTTNTIKTKQTTKTAGQPTNINKGDKCNKQKNNKDNWQREDMTLIDLVGSFGLFWNSKALLHRTVLCNTHFVWNMFTFLTNENNNTVPKNRNGS